jgi:hypothetical protein
VEGAERAKTSPLGTLSRAARRRGNSIALVVLLPTVVHCTHVVGPITFAWGVKRLRRFSAVSQVFLMHFYRFFDLISPILRPARPPKSAPRAVQRP